MAKMNQTATVYNTLKKRIDSGYYSPAESLTETELASELGVSRNTIKKALLMLETDAYVTIEPNKGAKVRSFSKQEVLDYLQLRVEMEGFIVRLTVPCLSDADIARLEDIFARMGEVRAENNLLAYSDLNQQFHNILYESCPNRTAADIIIRLKNQMRKYNAKTILIAGRDARSYDEHRAILMAIKNRDTQTAEADMRQHIENVRKIYEDYYALLF